jgi:hypothetical protein
MPVFKELNKNVYQRLHIHLIHRITEKEKISNDSMKDPVRYSRILQKKLWDHTVMYLRYKFERGPMATFPNQFHSWWKKHYQYPGSQVKYIKVRLIPTTNCTLARLLIHKKPPRHMLRLTEQTNTS